MSAHDGPGAGQKVDLGGDAPESTEGAGAVPNKSLAAESVRSGGGFAENRGALPGSGPARDHHHHKHSAPGDGEAGAGALENQASYGGTAPSYVHGAIGQGGPHGKNLKEGGFDGEGPGKSIDAEPGSRSDPARAAADEFKFGEQEEGGERRERGGEGGGLGQGEGQFGALEGEREA